MTIRHLLAALAALLFPAVALHAFAGPTVQIRDDQYSGVISGASFVSNYVSVTGHYVELDPPEWYSDEDYPDDETQVPEGWPTNWVEILENWEWDEYVYVTNHIAAPWASSNETWTAEGGFSPHYWPGTNGIVRLGPDGIRALYGRYELAYVHPRVWDAMYAWRNTSQPAAYGSMSENSYVNLYGGRHEDDTGLGVVVVDTEPGARVVCNIVKDGAPVQVDDVVYYDGMVAFEPFAAGESNRPADMLTGDAQVAVYMQDRPGSEVPYLYVVARDWVTGAVRHYAVGNSYYRYGLEARTEYGSGQTFYCGRLTICLMRTIYADSQDPAVPGIAVFVGGDPVYYYENPYWTPPPETLVWGHVRSDLGFTVDARHVGPGGAGVRDWDGRLLVFRPLNAGSATFTLSGMSYGGSFRLGAYTVSRANPLSTVWLWPGWTDVMRELFVGGRSDVDVAAARAVSYGILGNVESPAQPSSARWRGINGWADESYSDVTAGGGCSVTLDESCFRHGRVYLDSADGLTDEDWAELEANGLPHVESRTGPYYANVADAMAHAAYLGGKATLIANPESGFDITGLSTSARLALADRSLVTNVTVSGTGPDASFTLEGGCIRGTVRLTDVAALITATVDGCVVADNVSQLDIRSHLDGQSIDNVLFDHVLLATNSNIVIGDGYYRGDMHVTGGSLHVTAGDFCPGVVAAGASPVSITGGYLPQVSLYDCTVQEFNPHSCDVLTVSNSPSLTVATRNTGMGTVRVYDTDELRIAANLDMLEAYRVGAMTVDPGVSVSSAVLCDTPFAVTNGSFATLVISNNTAATIGGSASVTGNALLSAPAVIVGGGELASATCDGCTSVVVSNATIASATLGDCGTVAVSNATLRTASLEHCESVDLYSVVADNDPGIVAVGCDVSAHTGAVRRLEVRDGSLSIHDVELVGNGWPAASDSGIVVSNSPVVVHSGMLAYANHGWDVDAGWRFGAFDAYDSPVTVLGGEFGWLRTAGATPVELRDAYFHQGVNISGATTVVVSNCTVGETGNRRLYLRVGGSSITATESVVISGSPGVQVFALSSTITAPSVTISGGVYYEMTLSSPNATIIDGTFEQDIILSPRVSAGGHRVTVHGGKFFRGNYYNDVSGTGRLQLAPGKKFVLVGDYYEVQNQ